ncbi:MAG: hypothetical protein KAI66_06340, partial [Lentisphaeria bacterium]|nr:hypothetical protein [Lentisphaeria bacterium]
MSRALRTAQSMEGEALASQAQCELRRFGRQKLPLNVRNSVEGSRYLIEAVERCCAKYRIAKS